MLILFYSGVITIDHFGILILKNLLLASLTMMSLSACNSGGDSKSPTAYNENLANEVDKLMIKQVSEFMSANFWKGFDYKNNAQYMIRIDENNKPVAAFIINPKSDIKGAKKLTNKEAQGLNVWRYDAAMSGAISNIDGGHIGGAGSQDNKKADGTYTLSYKIDGYSYYAQKYSKNDNHGVHPFTNRLTFSPHENFHNYQESWKKNSDHSQDLKNYPINAEIIADELMISKIFDGLPKKITSEDAKDLLRKYVAIRQNQIIHDNTGLAKKHFSHQERGEGSAEYLENTISREIYKDKYSIPFYKKSPSEGYKKVDYGTADNVRWTFGWHAFYGSGSSALYLLNQIGYNVEDIEQGDSPFEAAKKMVGYDQSYYDKAKGSVDFNLINKLSEEYAAVK